MLDPRLYIYAKSIKLFTSGINYFQSLSLDILATNCIYESLKPLGCLGQSLFILFVSCPLSVLKVWFSNVHL